MKKEEAEEDLPSSVSELSQSLNVLPLPRDDDIDFGTAANGEPPTAERKRWNTDLDIQTIGQFGGD